MGKSSNIEHGEIVDVETFEASVERNIQMGRYPEHRDLTPREVSLLERGHDLDGGLNRQGDGVRTNFADVSPDKMAEYRQRAIQTRKLNTAAKKLMEQAAYLEAHKEHAATILGGRLAIIEGLLTEMVDPKTQKPDTRLLDEKRLKVLQTALNDFDKGMGMQPSKSASDADIRVNVTHTVSKIIDSLGQGT